MKQPKLKTMLTEKQFIEAPGIYDALTARIAESKGFAAVYMTGFGTAAAQFGFPDIGLLTMTEMIENARRIAGAVSVPLISDADTGYGNPINVYRTVREFERAGVAAIHIEDQTWPKRCGHMDGKQVISAEDMVGKINAALDARDSADFLVIARTDAIAVTCFDDAVDRANQYAEAGADLIFLDAPTSLAQVEQIPHRVASKPNVLNLGPRTPNLSAEAIEKMGYAMVIYPGVSLAAAIDGCNRELERVRETGGQRPYSDWTQSFAALNMYLGADRYRALENRCTPNTGR